MRWIIYKKMIDRSKRRKVARKRKWRETIKWHKTKTSRKVRGKGEKKVC